MRRLRFWLGSASSLLVSCWILGSALAQNADSVDEAPAVGEEEASATTGGDEESVGEETPGSDPSAEKNEAKILFGRIDSDIGLAESAYLKRMIEAAELEGAGVLALELNTFGGRLDAAVAMRDLLLDTSLETVVFINRRAISAGALISLASHHIAISPGGTIGAATPVVQAPGQELAQPVEEKYLSYFREEMRATAEARGRDADVAEAMVDSDKVVEGVSDEGKLLTLSTKSALETGIADLEAKSLEEALEAFGFHGPQETLERSWSENLVEFLTSTPMVSLLGFAMLFFAYMEYQSPGFGGFGFGALACFLLLYFGHYMVNLAGWEELLLFSLGMGLLLVEILVIPGFGVAGVLGLTSILVSFSMLLAAGDWSDFSFENPFTLQAATQVLLTLLLSLGAIAAMIFWLPKSRSPVLRGRFVLQQELATAEGFQSHDEENDDLVGELGEVVTPLRPSGKAKIGERRVDVETEGGFVAAGESVKVLRQEPGRIVVRKV